MVHALKCVRNLVLAKGMHAVVYTDRQRMSCGYDKRTCLGQEHLVSFVEVHQCKEHKAQSKDVNRRIVRFVLHDLWGHETWCSRITPNHGRRGQHLVLCQSEVCDLYLKLATDATRKERCVVSRNVNISKLK